MTSRGELGNRAAILPIPKRRQSYLMTLQGLARKEKFLKIDTYT